MAAGNVDGILVFTAGKELSQKCLDDFFVGKQLIHRRVVFDLSEVELTQEPERRVLIQYCAELFYFQCHVAICARPMLGYTLLEALEGYAELFFSRDDAIASVLGSAAVGGVVTD